MNALKQSQKSISDFGSEIEKLAAKLAAAHVSMGTFENEAAANNIVEPIAVQSFIDGLKDPSTKFFLKARNPPSLNKAISDALECQATPNTHNMMDNMMALWCTSNNFQRGGYLPRGNYPTRGTYFRGHGYEGNRGRGFNRGRGYYQNQSGYHQQSQQQRQNNQRGYYRGQPRGYPNSYRGRGNVANIANASPQEQQQQQTQSNNSQRQNQNEEANLIDLFR